MSNSAMGLSDALEQLRAEIADSAEKAADADIKFPVTSITVELQAVLTRTGEGKAGFKIPVIDLEVGGGGSLAKEQTHTITVVLSGPRNRSGDPVDVASSRREPKH